MSEPADVTFTGGRNIAMKVPPHLWEATVEFYRGVLGLPVIEHPPTMLPSVCFGFSANQLWMGRVDTVSHAELWLEVAASGVPAAARHLRAVGSCGVTRSSHSRQITRASGSPTRHPSSIIHHIAGTVPESEAAMASTQSEVRALLDRWSEAIRSKDLERLTALYAPDIVYFDIVPPLQYSGSAAVRRNFQRWFDGWQSAIGVEIRDLSLLASGDLAIAYMLHRTSGTLQDGREVDYWLRATVGCHRSDHGWLITHEHVSLPVDPGSGSAVMDLVP